MVRVVPAEGYDLVAVGRVSLDGAAPSSHQVAYLGLSGVTVSGGRALGRVEPRGGTGLSFEGTWDAESGLFTASPLTGALTSTSSSEAIEQLGGKVSDGRPADTTGDELSGYVRTRRGTRVFDATVVGISRIASRPAHPDEAKIAATSDALGKGTITGMAGAVPAPSAVEALVFTLASGTPKVTSGEAHADGGFSFAIDAFPGDLVLVRAAQVGVPGDARPVVVTAR